MLPLALALLAGCPDRTISEVNPEQGRVEYKDIPITVNRDIDILFVIDNSKSMADKQLNLTTNFPDFINVLQGIPGGLPNVHIGVVSSDMGGSATMDGPATGVSGCNGRGDNGALRTHPSIMGNYISDTDPMETGTRTKNYTGDLATAFTNIATVGDTGCGFEQHLASMKAALTSPANTNFLRPNAYLAVIFIADEDDCSFSHAAGLGPESAALGTLQSFRCTRFGVTCDQNGATTDAMKQVGSKGQCHPNDDSQYIEKVSTYVQFLKGLKPGKEKNVIVAGIMGSLDPFQVELRTPMGQTTPPEPALAHSCSYNGATGLEVADPPIRLKYFLDQFPDRSAFTTICQPNLSDGLSVIANLLRSVVGDPCIQGTLMDVDKTMDGPQYECSVSYVTNPGSTNAPETIIPACDASATQKPCWRIITDADKCSLDDHLMLEVVRTQEPAPETHIIANCVTEAI